MYLANQVRSLMFAFLMLALGACAPAISSGQAPGVNPSPSSILPTATVFVKPVESSTPISPTSTKSVQATLTSKPSATPAPTRTPIQLPLNVSPIDGSGLPCNSPSVELSKSDVQGLSEDEITTKLVELYLSFYTGLENLSRCRVDGYQVDEILQITPEKSKAYNPQGDFLRWVRFSVKLIQLNSTWMTYAGEIDQENWLHTANAFAVTKTLNPASEEVYTIDLAFP